MAHLAGGLIINANRVGNYCSANSGVVVGKKASKRGRHGHSGDHLEIQKLNKNPGTSTDVYARTVGAKEHLSGGTLVQVNRP